MGSPAAFHSIARYGAVVLGLVLVFKIVKVITSTYRTRVRYQDIVSLPRHWIWGNLVNCGQRLNPSIDRHPDYAFEEMWKELGQPSAFLMDLKPVNGMFLIVAEPDVAEQITQPFPGYKYSAVKSDTMRMLDRLIGKGSMFRAEGEEWKHLRRRFNRGFASSHLHSLTPFIIEKTRLFVERLQFQARESSIAPLKGLTQDLTTDIITQLIIEEDFHSQSTPENQGPKSFLGVLTASRILSSLAFKAGQGLHLSSILDPIRPLQSWFYEQVFDYHLRRLLVGKLARENKTTTTKPPVSGQSVSGPKSTATMDDSSDHNPSSGKAIVQLALAGIEPTPAIVNNTVSQIKTFLFAGQDTTATAIQWCTYELSRASPATLMRLRSEHDAAFGSAHPFTGLDMLSTAPAHQSENMLNTKIPYTTAFIKETLRVHPPAATARLVPDANTSGGPEVYIRMREKSAPVRIDGLRVYICQWLVHRNKRIWGPDAHVFRPDRWLDDKYIGGLPAGSYRPFERGPRNCIGQDLAMNEIKIVLVAVARAFTFEKHGLTGCNGEEDIYSVMRVTSIPADGMVMKVSCRPGGDRAMRFLQDTLKTPVK